MNSKTASLCLLALALASAAAPSAQSGLFGSGNKARVFVDSVATEEYQARRDNPDAAPYETYYFFRGTYHGGNIRDNSLNEVSFEEIVESLASEMKAQNYLPASDMTSGDLFIVVHWGTTEVDDFDEMIEDMMQGDDDFGGDDFGEEEGGFQDVPLNEDQDFLRSATAANRRVNAGILGFDRALNSRGLMPHDEYELQMDMEDERYFIILMAFDFQHMLKAKETKLLWSTRFSVRSIGTNFEEAYEALTRAAAPYYGTHLDKFERAQTHFGEGEVDINEIEVLDDEEGEGEPKK